MSACRTSRPRIAVWLAVLVGACGGGMQQGVTPATPPAPAPAPPPVLEVARWRPSYSAAPLAFRVRVEARLDRDSAGRREEAPVTTTARLSVGWPQGRAGRVSGRISEFLVTGSDRVSDPTRRAEPLTVAFEGTADSTTLQLAVVPALANECDAPPAAALALVRDVLVRWPGELTVGRTWRDSSTVFACRGGVPITTRVRARYEVRAGSDNDLLEVVRRTELELAGDLKQPWRAVIVRGRGTGEHRYQLSRQRGALVRIEGETASELTVTDASRGGEQRVRQTVTLRVEREP